MDAALRAELLRLIADDDATRERLAATGALFEGYHPEMEAVHRRNAAALRALIEQHGWPGRRLAGDDGAEAAWRIAQHAIGEPDFVRDAHRRIEAAVAIGDADPSWSAMMEDRIRVFEGRPQRYGTQYDWDDAGRMVPIGGIEAPAELDARRAAVGLGPMRWELPAPEDEPRPDPARRAARASEAAAWAVRVGWRG
jgi:hypothetical protein